MPVTRDPRYVETCAKVNRANIKVGKAKDLALRESNYWKEFDEENVLFEPLVEQTRELVAGELRALGGEPRQRADFITDNGNQILDVHGLKIDDALDLESRINQLTGVVCVGLFAQRPADLLILSGDDGIKTLQA